MCGLAGVVMRNAGNRADVRVAARMADSLLHRGPDEGNTFSEGGVAFGHRRLKIIDLSQRAAQPMRTRDGRFTIVFNGEIYNFRELRSWLSGRGHRFQSESDTEVLLELYAAHGRGMLERLNGIFAFAVWDARAKVLFAARDHLGVKPFYWAADRDRLLFASEVKALIAGGWTAAVDEARIGEVIAFGAVAGEGTLFQGVRRLAPGSWMELRPGEEPLLGRFFDPAATTAGGAGERLDRVGAAREVRAALDSAVERQMVSDVPVGAMCSGGLDSSAVTALSGRHNPGINTFCIKIDAPGCDESGYGRVAAEHCHAHHHEIESRARDVVSLLPTLVWLHDEPLRHPNSIPIFQVSRLARESVIVLLSGEGADEIFAGYGRHERARLVRRMQRLIPRFVGRAALLVAARTGRPGVLKALAGIVAPTGGAFLVEQQAAIDLATLARLVPGVCVDTSSRGALAEAAWRGGDGDPVQAALLYDQVTHLPTLLDRQDKMCMGASIESRVPFLDIDLVRLANRLPARYKLHGRETKAVLRHAVSDLLPPEIRNRPKYAFGLPLHRWMVETDCFGMGDAMATGELVRAGVLPRASLAEIVRAVRAGSHAQADVLWNLIGLETWWSVFISKTLQPRLTELPAYSVSRQEVAQV